MGKIKSMLIYLEKYQCTITHGVNNTLSVLQVIHTWKMNGYILKFDMCYAFLTTFQL
jgi:hypothetical protein